MPAPRLKREKSEPQKDLTRGEDQLIPALLTSVAQEVCAAMRARGAVIAAVDSQGIRCVASAGIAPAAASRLESDASLAAECLRTGKVVFRDKAKKRSRATASTQVRPSTHSAVAVPIVAEGITVGAIEVFSSRPPAIYEADIAPLEGIADFLAPILAPASVYQAKRAARASATDAVQTEALLQPEKTPTAPHTAAHQDNSQSSTGEQNAAPVTAGIAQRLMHKTTVAMARFTSAVRVVLEGFAAKTASARAWVARSAATMAHLFTQDALTKRSLAGVAVLLAAVVLFVGFHARFVKSSDSAGRQASSDTGAAAHTKTAAGTPVPESEGQGREPLSHRAPSVAVPAVASQSKPESESPAVGAAVAPTSPAIPAQTRVADTEAAAQRVPSLPPGPKPVVLVDNQPPSGPPSSVPQGLEAGVEPRELPVESAPKVPVIDVAPSVPAAIEAAKISSPAFVLDRTFKGHSSWVTSVVFSRDGRRLASGSWDQTVKFWDVPSGHEVDTLGRKMKEVQALALSRDGQWLAAENSSDTVTLWDVTTGTTVRTLPSNKPLGPLGTNFVYSIAFSPDGRWLASGVDEKTVRLWDVRTGRIVRDLTTARRSVIYAAFSPDGRWFASGDDDKSIRIWEASTGEEIKRLVGHRKPIYAVAFSPDGRWLASASADKTIKLWDVAEGREVHTLAGHGGSVTSLAFSPDGRWLASGSWDKTIKIWSVGTGREVQTLGGGHEHSIYTVAFDSRGLWLASGSEDGSISLWRLGGGLDRARLQ